MKERKKIDFTDNELRVICNAVDRYLNCRETWINKGQAKIINSVIKKITSNGLERKNPENIISSIYNF